MKIIECDKINILEFEKIHGLELICEEKYFGWRVWFEGIFFKNFCQNLGFHWEKATGKGETMKEALDDLCTQISGRAYKTKCCHENMEAEPDEKSTCTPKIFYSEIPLNTSGKYI